MSELLAEALATEGLDEAAADRVRKYMADRGFYVTENWLHRENREKEAAKVEREAAHAAALAVSIPYAGAIKGCQARVWGTGRGATSNRCQKTARFVVWRKDEFSGHRDRPRGPDRPTDNRLAVCRIHAADKSSHRHHGHWNYELCADEPVEPEYQPPIKEATTIERDML